MFVADYIHAIAGSMIIVSLAMAQIHTQYWLFLTLFVGLNLFQFGFSKVCPLGMALEKVGVNKK